MKEAWPHHPSVMSAQSCESFWEISTSSEQCCYLFPTEPLPFHHVFSSFNLWQVLIKKESKTATERGCGPAALIPDSQHAASLFRQASPEFPSLSHSNKTCLLHWVDLELYKVSRAAYWHVYYLLDQPNGGVVWHIGKKLRALKNSLKTRKGWIMLGKRNWT